ncbi:hypothetical protein VB773_08900 [Haloarculaceae archaeon H-GB2-1]|nr:hypothetical protein [Haloarculaceae archaeon H-GB1-1]MEA5386168.1 hypothetical protein [Haloarculaceae archaeon H-GB11]MEA5407674.1 hypothetical protein [Haloarculaceae archaeon H-GB2-1]
MAADESERRVSQHPPLEHTAFFDIDVVEGYVRIEQSLGDQTLYTPDEAEDIAEAILDAVEQTDDS